MVMHPFNMKAVATRWVVLVFFLVLGVPNLGKAQETTCARVQIQILQELTLERQAFDATMKINNTTDAGVIENVSAVVKVSDELGTPVPISSNPNDLSAKFFVKVSSKVAINDVDGGGTVNPQTTAVIDWLLIPAPGSAGTSPLGKKYLVGATLKYRFNGQDTTLDVSPDVITVKPLPLLTLDYFLPTDVYADDALTPEVEPVVPFTLGVRVRNNGFATAKNLKIDSAQPKIVENKQGLLIGFKLDGSYVDDAPVNDGLLLNFGDVAPSTNRMGRWVMETTLAGRFSDFTATFTHSDDLGGQLTSILQATNAHVLLQDVRVDLPGRDAVRDFLALDAGVVRVYESDGPDSLVNDRSGVAQLLSASSNGDIANYNLSFPPTDGFVFVKLGDPFSGSKVPGAVLRSDGKLLPGENVWLSKTRDPVSKVWSYYVNFFDVNSTGSYRAEFTPPPTGNLPPNLGLIADHTVAEGKQVSFLVEASSPAGKPVTITAAPLPAGARLLPQPADPQAPTLTRVAFDWTPAVGQAGTYLIVYTATDGTLSATRSAKITVVTNAPPGGPGAPSITEPLSGAQVPAVKPTLSALASTAAQDPTTQLQFELYADEAMNQLVASALQPKAPDAPGNGAGSVPQPTTWQVPSDLQDNTRYWWRVRAFDGTNYSLWANGRFFVNLFNDPPERFNLLLPVPGGEVADGQPVLNWANAVDKDGDVVTYGVRVYRDAALTDGAAGVEGLAADLSGASQWQVTPALTSRRLYYWNVTATDALGAKTVTAARSFIVGIGNMAPTAPGIASPVSGSLVPSLQVDLTVSNSTDADGDLITYVFELDTVPAFNSGAKRVSSQIVQGGGPTTAWRVTGLAENTRYYWRAKAQDGRTESGWVQGDFLASAVNDMPSVPTARNPGMAAWVSSLAPTLELNPSVDPEGGAVSYEFQVAQSPLFSPLVRGGSSATTAWSLPSLLADKTTYWWRGRAVDAEGTASAWSVPMLMYVSTGTYQNPSIQLTDPSTILAPTVQGARKLVRLSWLATDLNIEPTVSLYYAPNKASFSGTQIVGGMRQAAAGTQAGSYDWDVSGVPVGTYYVYAVIHDPRGTGQAWAPGAVVVTPDAPSGSVAVNAAANLQTSERGTQAQFGVRLGSQPAADVVLPVASTMASEGAASPPSLSFTPQNWNVDQTVTVTGQADCIPDGNRQYQVLVGKAVSLDPQYMGLAAPAVALTNQDASPAWTVTGNNVNVRICSLTVKSSSKVDATTWEYVLEATFGNSGVAVAGGVAKLVGVPPLLTVTDPDMQFGALNQGETGKSLDSITVRSKGPLSVAFFQSGAGLRWMLTVR